MKTKNKKKNLSDSLRKKVTLTKTLNPFEVHINRQKFQVIGRKQKFEKGLPGIARAKSIKKRKETLLQEFKVKDKANKFIDRRIGERNSAMTAEDKLTARFTAERVRAHNKKAMFNLAEDEVLTHKGQTLSEIEKFDDPRSDDEDDGEFSKSGGRLDAQFVDEAHFGGGMFSKGEEGHKSRASIIEELISESKKRKAERQQAKEKTLKLTEKLDADWKDLLPLAFANQAKTEEDKPMRESYDIVMRELKFEARGIPSDKLKSESEIAKEEKERLEKLEEERLRRMKGFDEPVNRVINHRSADDLDDGFEFEDNLNENDNEKNDEELDDDTNDRETSSEEDEDMEESAEGKEDYANSAVAEEDEEMKEVEENAEVADNENAENSDGSDSDNDSLSDLKGFQEDNSEASDNESEENEELEKKQKLKTNSEKCIRTLKSKTVSPDKNKINNTNQINNDLQLDNEANDDESKMDLDKFKEELLEKKRLMEDARKELPYTFKVPETYEELQEMMTDKSAETQCVIVERMIKCNHPSLANDNKEKLKTLFAFLLQLLNDADEDDCWRLLDRLSPHLFDLTQFSPDNAAHCISEVLKEKQADFKSRPHRYPSSDTLVFLQLVALLFPTSDARHQITTPAMIFLGQILFQCRVSTAREIASGLLVTTIVSQYISLSKRFCGEAINFLRGCLSLALPAEIKTENIPPFKEAQRLLVLSQPCDTRIDRPDDDLRMRCSDLTLDSVIDESFRVRTLNATIQLLTQFARYYENLSAFTVIFKPCLDIIRHIPLSYYPESVRENADVLENLLVQFSSRKIYYVALERKKPKTLKMYEPDIQKVYDRKSYHYLPQDKLEQQKLLHKYKREMKGALREVRRDKSFLAKIKFKNQAKSDEERMQKVKQIYSWGANQEGELRKLKRKKS